MKLKPANWRITQKQAAQMMNVSVRSIQRATRVQKYGVPELGELVVAGRMNLHQAEQAIHLSHEDQKILVDKIRGGASFKETLRTSPSHHDPWKNTPDPDPGTVINCVRRLLEQGYLVGQIGWILVNWGRNARNKEERRR